MSVFGLGDLLEAVVKPVGYFVAAVDLASVGVLVVMSPALFHILRHLICLVFVFVTLPVFFYQ